MRCHGTGRLLTRMRSESGIQSINIVAPMLRRAISPESVRNPALGTRHPDRVHPDTHSARACEETRQWKDAGQRPAPDGGAAARWVHRWWKRPFQTHLANEVMKVTTMRPRGGLAKVRVDAMVSTL